MVKHEGCSVRNRSVAEAHTRFHEYFTRVYGQFIEFGNGITITSDSLTRMNSTLDYHALAPSAVADCNLENPALKTSSQVRKKHWAMCYVKLRRSGIVKIKTWGLLVLRHARRLEMETSVQK